MVKIAAAKNVLKRPGFAEAVLLLLLTLIVARGWLNSEIPKGTDTMAGYPLSHAVSEALSHFQFLPLYGNDWNTGSPLFAVLSPLFSFIEILPFGILGVVSGTKAICFLMFWLAGVFMYFFVRNLTNSRPAGFVAALIYMFSPFALVEFVFEGHGHPFFAFMLTPLLFWSLERAVRKPSLGRAALCGVLLSLVILSYPQAFPLLVGPFFVAYLVFHLVTSFRNSHQTGSGLGATAVILLIGLGLSAFWWLPLLFEKGLMYSAAYSKQESWQWSLTLWQAVTLRPTSPWSDLAPSASSPLYISFLEMIVVGLSLMGLALNYRKGRVWFFAIMAAISILLAMGLNSTIGLYGFCFDHIPFFDSMRSPGRFLLFATFCYSVLGGYAIVALERVIRGRVRHLLLITAISVLVVGNVWTESQQAFQTFRLSPDQEKAFAWLKDQEKGDYRITCLPFDSWAYSPEAGTTIVDPVYWGYPHGKETVYGGAPMTATKYTANILEALGTDLTNNRSNLGEWLNIFNVKYVVLDKTNPLSSSVILGESFERVWTSDTIDIYQNHSMKPRIFSFTNANERVIDLYTGSTINLSYAGGTQEAMLSLDNAHSRSGGLSLRSVYRFTDPSFDWLSLGVDATNIDFSQDDVIHLSFYSELAQPDIHLSLDLIERNGSRYDAILDAMDGIKVGWNEVSFPISLLNLRYSEDENNRLDLDQIERLEFGIGEDQNFDTPHEFEVYFNELSLVSQEIDTDIEYTKIRPGKYEVQVDSDKPSYLVLAESYHPNWVARHNGQEVPSQMIYECLNSFRLEAGDYEVTLEFVSSPARKAGNIISGISIVALCSLAVVLLVRRKKK